jgi:DNA-binding MarR family transcriptional regulator
MSSQNRAALFESLTAEVRKFIAGAILFNDKVASDVGLNVTDLQFLNVLELQGSATPSDFARWSGLTSGGVTVVLDRLEKAGYIKRQPNPEDRRSTIIRGVAPRMRKLREIYQAKGDLLAGVLAKYNDRQLKLILDFLERTNGADTITGE